MTRDLLYDWHVSTFEGPVDWENTRYPNGPADPLSEYWIRGVTRSEAERQATVRAPAGTDWSLGRFYKVQQ
jgi:hypothetical protein